MTGATAMPPATTTAPDAEAPPRARRRARLGWLGPVIAVVGLAAGTAGGWYMTRARPQAGAVLDTIRIDDHSAFVVRAEAGGSRNFVELHEGERVAWSALVPAYAGRPGAPGIAWNETAVSVRVLRDGRAEVFALARHDASKLGGFQLAAEHGEAVRATRGPVTLTDYARSYELVEGSGWHQLVAFDLTSGEGIWKQELGPAALDDGGVIPSDDGGTVWISQAGARREFRARDGQERTPAPR